MKRLLGPGQNAGMWWCPDCGKVFKKPAQRYVDGRCWHSSHCHSSLHHVTVFVDDLGEPRRR